jgi:hydroxymethylbilane synthase
LADGRIVRVGCRGTDFCRAQTAGVLRRLAECRPDVSFEIVDVEGAPLPSTGDDHPLLEALAAGVFDLHLRGAREVPVKLSEGIVLAACTQRVDPFDVFIARNGDLLEDLPTGSRVGVESSRVAVQLVAFREDLEIEKMPGTVDRFMERLEAGNIAGFVVAAEDVETLGWEASVSEVFPPDIVLPAAGQGCFALLTRADDEEMIAIAQEIDHEISRQVVLAERAFLQELSVRLTDPVAVHGSFEGDDLVIEAMLADEVSGAILRDDLDGDPSEEAALGVRLAKLFVADGARDYLAGYE